MKRWSAALVLLLLAGCAATPPMTKVSTETPLKAVAQAKAKDWDPEAKLVSVSTIQSTEATGPTGLGNISDPSATDGHAPTWRFTFYASTASHRFLVYKDEVKADMAVTRAYESNATLEPYLNPLESWKLDSAAASRAAFSSKEWAAKGTPTKASMVLLHFPRAPAIWMFDATFAAGEERLLIDADNGTVVSGDGIALIQLPEAEGGIFEGRLLPNDPAEHRSFVLRTQLAPGLGVKAVAKDGSVLPASARLRVEGPGQEPVTSDLTIEPGGSQAVAQVLLARPLAGNWTARLELTSGAVLDYQIRWCAAGLSADKIPACSM